MHLDIISYQLDMALTLTLTMWMEMEQHSNIMQAASGVAS
jgi:hypothetical protein